MKSPSRILLVLFICLLIPVGAYFLAIGMMESIYDYQSPLHPSAPEPGPAIESDSPRQVVFILIDALRYDTSLKSEVMPTVNELRSQGAYARMHSRTPSYSSPGYGVLLTGAWPELSSSPAFNLDYEDIRTITQDNLFSSAHRLGLKTGISAFNWFEKLVPQSAVDFSFYTAGEDQTADRAVVDAALPWIQSGEVDLILIHLDQVDYAGHHEGGPASPNWDQAAGRADALVAEILANMDLEQDVIFICSDHGQIDAGGHGGPEQVTLTEPFILAGKGITPGDFGEVNMVDVAPTLAAILGINLPAAAQGEVQVAMLGGLSEKARESLPLESARQQVQLLGLYGTAIGAVFPDSELGLDKIKTVDEYQNLLEDARSQRLDRERLPRLVIALMSLALAVFVVWRWKFFGRQRLFRGVLLYLVLFNLIYLLFGPGVYSYSTIVAQMAFILTNGVMSLIAMVLAWFVIIWLRRSTSTPADMALETAYFALITAIILFLPVVIHWVWNGMYVTWALPDMTLHFLALLSLVQIIFVSAAGLILAAISSQIIRLKKPAAA